MKKARNAKGSTRMIEGKGEKIFYIAIYVIVTLVMLTMIFPLLNVISTSLSSEHAVVTNQVSFYPVEFTTNTYVQVMRTTPMWMAIGNTLKLTLVGTAISMFVTICTAYALSKKRLLGRSFFLGVVTLMMIISAGMIPNFLNIKNLNLMNTYWAIWLPGMLNTWNMLVMKTFFSALPDALEESALIDGANDLRILVSIVLPLSLPSIATITLFYAVGYWNSYFNMIMYVTKSDLKVLQVLLRDIVAAAGDITQMAQLDSSESMQAMAGESVKAAAIVIATIPIMLVYPFLQKYFVKGVMIGSVKG